MVMPQGRVIYLKTFSARGKTKTWVYLETPKKYRGKNLRSVVAKLGPKAGRYLRKDYKTIRDAAFIHGLLGLW